MTKLMHYIKTNKLKFEHLVIRHVSFKVLSCNKLQDMAIYFNFLLINDNLVTVTLSNCDVMDFFECPRWRISSVFVLL